MKNDERKYHREKSQEQFTTKQKSQPKKNSFSISIRQHFNSHTRKSSLNSLTEKLQVVMLPSIKRNLKSVFKNCQMKMSKISV